MTQGKRERQIRVRVRLIAAGCMFQGLTFPSVRTGTCWNAWVMQFILLELALEKSFTGEFDIVNMDEVSPLCYREEISRDYLFLWRNLLYGWKLKRDQMFFSFCFVFTFHSLSQPPYVYKKWFGYSQMQKCNLIRHLRNHRENLNIYFFLNGFLWIKIF